jgi:hypothetical protein
MTADDDDLIRRLQASMPVAGSVHHTDSAHAASLMEQIMTTPLETAQPATAHPRRRVGWLITGGVAAAVGAGALAIATLGGGSSPTTVAYRLPGNDVMAMCITLSEFQPSPDMLGFGGTVSSIEDGVVTLDVDRWYRGGPADQVQLDASGLPMVALDGVEFVVGQRYLVSIIDGTVGLCGTSGPATPEFEQIFAGWFA